ncbi:MAG: hypothetical protein HUJ86_01925 [Synergistes sp.]|nr:hypothetical protein [Synergistes sp.]
MTERRNFTLKIEFLSYWHAGSGLGRGKDIDAVVLKSRDGLPYLPGRTVKGLLKEAFENLSEIGLCSDDTVMTVFGSEGSRNSEGQGTITVENALLPENERAFLSSAEGEVLKSGLYETLSSTAIDKDGRAKDRSLRTIEVAVPVTLFSEITITDSAEADLSLNKFEELLNKACGLIRSAGSHRNRGFGRCRCSCAKRGE